MKKILLPFFVLTLLTACEKEQVVPDTELEARANKVTICHYDSDNDTWHVISVNKNAWPAHANHGDVRLDDQDADGYVPDNECGYGQQGDCDDNNAAVNPGASELCDNGIDDDCDGDVDEADSDCETSCVEGELGVTVDTGSETYTLYVYPSDNSSGISWGALGITTGATSNWDGADNTDKIVAELGEGNYAAKVCADLAATTGCDWYLPSKNELNEMWKELGPINNGHNGSGDMPVGIYWSSSEFNALEAWSLLVVNGIGGARIKDEAEGRCRCVRR